MFVPVHHVQAAARREEEAAARALAPIFASLHKRAFGVAVGTAAGLAVAVLTLVNLTVDPGRRFPLELLGNYLEGYAMSPVGALVGAAWSFAIGFVAGWFVAFTRNLVLTLWLVVARAKLHFAQSRNFLDHL